MRSYERSVRKNQKEASEGRVGRFSVKGTGPQDGQELPQFPVIAGGKNK